MIYPSDLAGEENRVFAYIASFFGGIVRISGVVGSTSRGAVYAVIYGRLGEMSMRYTGSMACVATNTATLPDGSTALLGCIFFRVLAKAIFILSVSTPFSSLRLG